MPAGDMLGEIGVVVTTEANTTGITTMRTAMEALSKEVKNASSSMQTAFKNLGTPKGWDNAPIIRARIKANEALQKAEARLTAVLMTEDGKRTAIAAGAMRVAKTEAEAEAKAKGMITAVQQKSSAERLRIEEETRAKTNAIIRGAGVDAAKVANSNKTQSTRILMEAKSEAKGVYASSMAEREAIKEQEKTQILAIEEALLRDLERIYMQEAAAADKRDREIGKAGRGMSGAVIKEEKDNARKQEQAVNARARAKERMMNSGYSISRGGDQTLTGGAFLAAPLVAATLAASKFQTEMLKATNNTDLSAKAAQQLSANVQQLVREGSNADLDKLFAGGMRAANFRKEGQTNAETLNIQRVAAQAAAGSYADVEKTTEALAREMYIYNVQNKDAPRLMNVLEVTAAHYNMSLEQMVENSGRLISMSSELKLPLNETISAFALLTKHGFNTSQAVTAMRNAVAGLVSPNSALTKKLQEMEKTMPGIQKAFSVQNVSALGLVGTLTKLHDEFHLTQQQILDMFPDYRKNQAFLVLLGSGFKELKEGVQEGNKAWNDNIRYQNNLQRVQQTTDFQLKAMENHLILASVGLTKYLLPAMNSLIGGLNNLIDKFEKLSPANKEAIVNTLKWSAGILLVTGGALKLVGGLVQLVKGVDDAIKVFKEMRLVMAGVELAEGETASAGVVAFAAAGPWALAIGAAVILIGGMALAWKAVSDAAQDAADKQTKAAADLASENTNNSHDNNANQISVNQNRINQLQDAVSSATSGRGRGSGAALQATGFTLPQAKAEIARIQKVNEDLKARELNTTDTTWNRDSLKLSVDNAAKTIQDGKARIEKLQSAINDYNKASGRGKGASLQSIGVSSIGQAEEELAKRKSDNLALYRDMQKNKKSLGLANIQVASEEAGNGIANGIAQSAMSFPPMDKGQSSWKDFCQRLLKKRVQEHTHDFDKFWSDTAADTMHKFQAAGVGHAYKPGEKLMPGDMLFNDVWGKRYNKKTKKWNTDGHAALVDVNGMASSDLGTKPTSSMPIGWVVSPRERGRGDLATKRWGNMPSPLMNNVGGPLHDWLPKKKEAKGKSGMGGGSGGVDAFNPMSIDTNLDPSNDMTGNGYQRSMAHSDADFAKQLAHVEKLDSALETLNAKKGFAHKEANDALYASNMFSNKLTAAINSQAGLYAAYVNAVNKHNAKGAEVENREKALAKLKSGKDVDPKKVYSATVALWKDKDTLAKTTKSVSDIKFSLEQAQTATKKFSTGFEEAEKNLERFQNQVDSTQSSINRVTAGMLQKQLTEYRNSAKAGVTDMQDEKADESAAGLKRAGEIGTPESVTNQGLQKTFEFLRDAPKQTDTIRQVTGELAAILANIAVLDGKIATKTGDVVRAQMADVYGNKHMSTDTRKDHLTSLYSQYASDNGIDFGDGSSQSDVQGQADKKGKQQGDTTRAYYKDIRNLSDQATNSILADNSNISKSLILKAKLQSADRQAFIDGMETQITGLQALTDLTEEQEHKRSAAILYDRNAVRIMQANWSRDDEKEAKSYQKAWEEASKGAKEALADGITEIVEGHKKGMSSLRSLFKDTFDAILKTIIKKFITDAIDNMSEIWKHKPETISDPGMAADPSSGPSSSSSGGLQDIGLITSAVGAFSGGSNRGGGAGGSSGGLGAFSGVLGAVGGILGAMGMKANASVGKSSSTDSAVGSAMSNFAAGDAQSKDTYAVTSSGASNGSDGTGIATAKEGAGMVAQAGSLAKVGGLFAKAMPWVSAALAVGGLLSSLGAQTHPDYTTKTAAFKNTSIDTDYSSTINSGFSGVAGMRTLMEAQTSAIARATGTSASASSGTVNFHENAIQVTAAPGQSSTEVANAVANQVSKLISGRTALDNAAHGTI